MKNWEQCSDSDLLLDARTSADPFGVFYERYFASVLAFFRRRVPGPEEAFDLTAETFAAALSSVPRFRPGPEPPQAWLFAIARHKLSEAQRSSRIQDEARRALAMQPIHLDDEAIEILEATASAPAVELLETLTPEQREAVKAQWSVLMSDPISDLKHELLTAAARQQSHAATGPERTRAHSRGRWVIVAVAGVVLVGGLLVTPALGLGDRLLGLIRSTPTPLDVQTPAWSPDGRKLAFVSRRDGNSEIYVINADGSGQENLTQHPARDSHPSWSRDGRKLAFESRRDGNSEIYVMSADGSGLRNVTRAPSNDLGPAWSPGGGAIAFVKIQGKCAGSAPDRRCSNNYGTYLYVVNADGSGLRRLTRHAENVPRSFAWSPDGRTMAFLHNREVYIVKADGSDERRLTQLNK